MTTSKTTPNDEQNHTIITIITSSDELLRRYAAGERDFHGVDLSGADLSGVDLSGADLSGADLRRADLYGADLYGADLYGAILSGADLSGAILRGVKNPPSSSHDFLAEILRQAAGTDYEKRSVAGLVLISRNWCWKDFGRVSQAHWSPELRAWIAATLAPWPALVTLARRYGVIERDAHANATDENASNEEA